MTIVETSIDQIVANYFESWNAEPADRPALITRTFTPDAYYCDGAAEAVGHEAIDLMMSGVMTQFAGSSFELASPIDSHHRQARFEWQMVGPDGSVVINGIDAIRFTEGGHISVALGFFGIEVPAGDSGLTSHTFRWEREYAATRERLFDLVTDLDVYAAVAPNLARIEVLSGDGEGLVRQCTNPEGESWTETYTEWSPPERFVVAPDASTYPPSLASMIAALEMAVEVTELSATRSKVSIEISTELSDLGLQALRDGGAADALFLPILDGWADRLV